MLEGLVIFVVLWVLSRRKRADGLIIGTLLVLYSAFRLFVELFREPDVQLGFIVGSVTMGQLLTIPMFVAGSWLVWRALASERAARMRDEAAGSAGRSRPRAAASGPTDLRQRPSSGQGGPSGPIQHGASRPMHFIACPGARRMSGLHFVQKNCGMRSDDVLHLRIVVGSRILLLEHVQKVAGHQVLSCGLARIVDANDRE